MSKEIFVEFTKPDPDKVKFVIYSDIIRKVQGTKYSHVRLRWDSNSGEELIYEASGRSVKLIGSLAQKDHPVVVVKSYGIKVSREEYRNLIKLFRFAGVDYGLDQALGILLVQLFKLKKNPLSNGRKSQVCSELVGVFLKEVKDWDIGVDLDIAGPLEIEQALSALVNSGESDIRVIL